MALDAGLAGDVEQAAQAEDRIHREPHYGVVGAFGLALQRVVHEGPDIAEVGEEIAHAIAGQTRSDVAVDRGHRLQDGTVQAVVERVDAAVERLERVLGIAGLARRGGAAAEQRSGGQCAQHGCALPGCCLDCRATRGRLFMVGCHSLPPAPELPPCSALP